MIAKHIQKIKPSGIREFFDLVLGMPDVISLGVGEPDFITPWRIREKAITALEEGLTTYTSNKGLFILRKAISDYILKKHSVFYDPNEEILITVGVSEALDLVLRAIIEPKDKIIVISPHFVAYPALVEICGGEVLYLITKEEENFKINLNEFKKLLEKKPKAIILNNPANPTGATYSKKELLEIWDILENKDILVISDEIYNELIYDEKPISFVSLNKNSKNKTVLLNGFSKAYAMTGFRIGYACAKKEIILAMNKIHSFSIMCAPIISQIAAIEAFEAEKELNEMKKEYKRRRDYIIRELNNLKLSVKKPEGAFYCFPSIKKYKLNSLEFAKKLLFEKKVAVVPGRAFGDEYDFYIRISYANSFENLNKAVLRIKEFLQSLDKNV